MDSPGAILRLNGGSSRRMNFWPASIKLEIGSLRFQTDDDELIQHVIAKDHSAFKLLVERYQKLVLNVCYHFIGNRQDAEDVSQDVFLQVYKTIGAFRGESKLSTWIYRIAVNRSLNFIRDHNRPKWLRGFSLLYDDSSEEPIDLPAPESDRPDITLEEKEKRAALRAAIDSLPSKQKTAFILHKLEGLSHEEISGIMRRSGSSVESLIHRAKLNLQKQLIGFIKEI